MYNVYIRPLKLEDAQVSYKWRNDPKIWIYAGSKPNKEITFQMENEWLKTAINENSSKRFAIIVDEVYVGNIQLTNITENAAEYHIFIGNKNYWRKGIAHLATYQLLHYAKEELTLENIYLTVHEENKAAVKSYLGSSFIIQTLNNGWLSMVCNLSALPKPAVSVFVMVHNHENYLRECLDGILMQQFKLPFNIVVGEDCSTDNSRKIILDYRNKYAGKFKLLLHEKNIGAVENQNAVLASANGKYIALCEGDDYWIDPLKLQKQVDALENNPKVKICSHPSERRYGDLLKKDNYGYWGNEVKIISAQQIIENYSTTAPLQTIMFKNENIRELTLILKQLLGGHSTIQIFYSLSGGLCYLPDYMSVYRVESSSSISKFLFKNDKTYLERQLVNWSNLELLNTYSNFRYNKEFEKAKRQRAISAIYTGTLTLKQKLFLIKKYKIYKDHLTIVYFFKNEMYFYIANLKKRIIKQLRAF